MVARWDVMPDAFVRAQRSWARVRAPLPYLRTAVVKRSGTFSCSITR